MHRMNPRTILLVAAASAMFATGRWAEADYVNFSFIAPPDDNRPGISGAGVLNLTSNGDGSYTAVSGMMAEFGDSRISTASLYVSPYGPGVGSYPNDPGHLFFDDQIFPAATPTLDFNGLLFATSGHIVNLFFYDGAFWYVEEDLKNGSEFINRALQFSLGPIQPGTAPVSPSAVPEPTSLVLGVLGAVTVLGFAAARPSRR